MSEELKSCPFCGGKADTRKFYPVGNHYPLHQDDIMCPVIYVGCENCGITTHYSIEQWNSRPIEDVLKEEIARYRRALCNLKDDCKRRMLFAESASEILFLSEVFEHIEAELGYGKDTNVSAKESRGER